MLLVGELPHIPEEPTNMPPSYSRRLFLWGRHTHHHYHPPGVPPSALYRNCGIGFALIGLGLTSYACYQYHISAEAIVRVADAAEVQAGLMTKEEFRTRHPKETSRG